MGLAQSSYEVVLTKTQLFDVKNEHMEATV